MKKRRTLKSKNGGRTTPQFRSLKQESGFWDSQSFLDFGKWEVVPYDQVCKELGSRNQPKQPVTFRLEKALIRRLKEAARRHGVKYQVLAREILWQSLSKKAE
jgi:predicted DNA binding CopG/RHH family protein